MANNHTLPDIVSDPSVQSVIDRALKEDIGTGDATSDALVDPKAQASAQIVAREACVVSGGPVARAVFHAVDKTIEVEFSIGDGTAIQRGTTVCELSGPARGILVGERTALNFLQRLSGIATLTAAYVDKVNEYETLILDTRKTTPSLRVLEKYAVSCGGGTNHRFGLYDQVLIKDNHLAVWSGASGRALGEAVTVAREKHPDLEIEIEVDTPEQFEDVIQASPDWILLDNMSPAQLKDLVERAGGRCKLEASGGITLETVAEVAAAGVDAISVGALTHSAVAADFALDFKHDG